MAARHGDRSAVGTCGGSLVVINGHPRPEHRRYGCGFRRDKGPRVCPNGLSVRVGTVESRLVATLRERVLQPAAIACLVGAVNQHVEAIRMAHGKARKAVEADLAHIETELRNIEATIVQDPAPANGVFRQILQPIMMLPTEKNGRHFYQATGAAKGPEMLDRLGLTAVDFGGCGGQQPPISKMLSFEVDLI